MAKPILVLDLDETLLHTVHDEDLPNGQRHRLTIPRPHLHEFLERMSEIFNLFVFTFGTHDYAIEVCTALGITKWIPPEKIYARDKGFHNPHTNRLQKRLDSILCSECSACSVVLDDSPGKALVSCI
jgi:hypothetical protein